MRDSEVLIPAAACTHPKLLLDDWGMFPIGDYVECCQAHLLGYSSQENWGC